MKFERVGSGVLFSIEMLRLKDGTRVKITGPSREAVAQMILGMDQCREALNEIVNQCPELFADGVESDLHDMGITGITEAYMQGLSNGLGMGKLVARTALAALERETK